MIEKIDEAVANALRLTAGDYVVPMTGLGLSLREYATQEQMGQEPKTNDEQATVEGRRGDQTVPVPVMVIERQSLKPSFGRSTNARHRYLRRSSDLNLITQAQHPMAIDIPYQLDILAKYSDDANIISALTFAKFPNREKRLMVDIGYPWGEKPMMLQLGDLVDNTDVEPEDETGQRETRITISFNLEGWLALDSLDVRTVRKVIATVELDWLNDARGRDQVVFEKTLEEG